MLMIGKFSCKMNAMLSKIFCILFLIARPSLAIEVSMNDIHLMDYGDYTEKWKLVTVRYRQDTHELRFTYANPLAWQSMQKGVKTYPDGSVFAKVGFKSGVDPAFNSSIVPSGARRFQFMVKDEKKYSETDGWGYALFQSNGELFEGDIKTATKACHACHKVVPERDFVFSEAIEISPALKIIQSTYALQKNQTHLVFSSLETKDFRNSLKKYSSKIKTKSIEVLQGEIQQFYFGGTLDELTPILIKNTIATKKASGFVSSDQNTFKIINLSNKSKKCTEFEYSLEVYELRSEWEKSRAVEITNICYSKENT